MNVWLLFAVSVWTAICSAIYAFLTDHDPEIKRRESTLSNHQLLALYGLRFLHYIVYVFFSLYAFVADVNAVYDFIALVCLVLIYVQWRIIKACVLSIFENYMLFGHTTSWDLMRLDQSSLRELRNILINVDRKYSQPWIESLGIPHGFLHAHCKRIWVAMLVLLARMFIDRYFF
jgi:hypothetical protein